jgi:catechol 2,3-dioxygenase-like lactoylglutathione lyase family enzyme
MPFDGNNQLEEVSMSAPVSAPVPGHVGLNVSRLDRSVAFYRAVLGFDLLRHSPEGPRPFAFLGHDGATVLTLWQQSEGGFAADRPGLHHLAFRVDTVDALREAESRLRALGARVHHDGIVAHAEGAESGGLFFEDPDGIRIEIFTASGLAGSPAPHGDAPTCGFF